MSIYSAIHEKGSLMNEKNFSIEIPGGLTTQQRDWFPFVMTYNADEYRARGGQVNGMTILYNFPAFDPFKRTNAFFEKDSPYCSAFYGAYIINSESSIPYCYTEEGTPDFNEVMHAFKYDYQNLVLESLGKCEFDFTVLNYSAIGSDYIGYSSWTMLNATIKTNSVVHNYSGPMRNYLQYGRPKFYTDIDFPQTTMYGRLFMRYFPEYETTVIFYIIAPDMNVLNDCDLQILSKSKINSK